MKCPCAIVPSVASPTLLYFTTFSHKRQDSRNIMLLKKKVFWFSLQLLSEEILILRRTERGMIKNIFLPSCKVPVILLRFVKEIEFSLHIFEMYRGIKFHENPSTGRRIVPCGQTERQTRRN